MWALTWFEGLLSCCIEEVALGFATICYEIGCQWAPWPFVEEKKSQKKFVWFRFERSFCWSSPHLCFKCFTGPAFEFITYLVQLSKSFTPRILVEAQNSVCSCTIAHSGSTSCTASFLVRLSHPVTFMPCSALTCLQQVCQCWKQRKNLQRCRSCC